MQPVAYPYLERSRVQQFASDWLYVVKWLLRKSVLAFHPPDLMAPPMKRAVLRRLARRYNLKNFVETGTYLGDTTESLSRICEHVFSIELQTVFYENAKKRFAGNPRVTLFSGSGPEALPTILGKLNSPALFWLDAHFPPAFGGDCCPTLKELVLILAHPQKHVICIDDMQDFTGENGYPTIAELKSLIPQDRSVEIKNDIMRIV